MMNNSNSNSTENGGKLPRSEGIVFCVAFLVESLAIIISNLITIVVFTRNRNLRKCKFYLLINLAVADLLVGAVSGPAWVYNINFSFDMWPEPQMDKTTAYWSTVAPEIIESFTKYASLISLTMVSLERMYATLLPVKYRSLKPRTYYVFIAFCWILSLFIPSVYLAMWHNLIQHKVSVYILLVFTCLLLLITCVSYITIWIKIKFGRNPLTAAQDIKFTVSLFVVTVVSVATWLPCQVIFCVYLISWSNKSPIWPGSIYDRVLHSTALLLFANSLVNPIIYSLRIPEFKQTAARLLCRKSYQARPEMMELGGRETEELGGKSSHTTL